MMVLLVAEESYSELTQSLDQELISNAYIRQTSLEFTNTQKVCIEKDDCLYVHQGEMAIVRPTLENSPSPTYLGSDDATSCYITIVQSTDFCVIGHLDSKLRVSSFFRQIASFLKEGLKIKIYIVGGFQDRFNSCKEVLDCILKYLTDNQKLFFDLILFCVRDLNVVNTANSLIQHPAVMGVVYDCIRELIKPAFFNWKARGPLAPLRLSRLYSTDGDAVSVYDSDLCCLVISSFSYALAWPSPNVTKSEILEHSTTPHQEPRTYIEGMTAVHKLMYYHPYPQSLWFQNGPLTFIWTQSSTSSHLWSPSTEHVSFVAGHPIMNVVENPR